MIQVIGYKKKDGKFIPYVLDGIEYAVGEGKVTYRGLGLGNKSNDFYNFSNQMGFSITYKNVEYYITETDFDYLNNINQIKFKAPFRKMV